MEYGPDGAGSSGVEFVRRYGYQVLLVEARRRLALPVSTTLLDALAAKSDPVYLIRFFSGPVPDDLVRDDERVLAETGQVKYNAAAVAADGTVAGYTDIVAGPVSEPAAQWGTLVRRAHRGHGLGYGLKAAVIRLLPRERPDIIATVTSNALTNAAMVAVNDQLGYEIVEYVGEVEKRRSRLRSPGRQARGRVELNGGPARTGQSLTEP